MNEINCASDKMQAMVIHVSTVGKSMDPILKGFRAGGPDLQILVHSKDTASVARKIAEHVEAIAGRNICEMKEVDPFDLNDIVSAILNVKRQHPGAELSVNMTGGTNIMASSALIACFMASAKAYYVKESKDRSQSLKESIIYLPVPKAPIDTLDEIQKKIIKYIAGKGGQINSIDQLLVVLDRRQLLSYHLKVLGKKELVDFETKGRNKKVLLTDTGKLFSKLL